MGRKQVDPPPGGGYTHKDELARAIGVSSALLSKLSHEGCISKPALGGWYETGKTLIELINHYRNQKTGGSKEQLEEEKLIALRLRNERMKGLAVSRAWVAAKIAALGGSVEDTRQRSILEDAQIIAGYAGDVPKTREALRQRWAVITERINRLADELANEPENASLSELNRGKLS